LLLFRTFCHVVYATKGLYLLQGLPQVGPMLAKRLIEHFGSVSKIINASTEELMEVEGIGTSIAAKIRDVLDSDYV
jgi:DNA excision repair protein ERCC-4